MAKKNGRVSPEAFVKVWQEADSAGDAANSLGLTLQAVRSRATIYRSKGIALKKMPRVGRTLDVEALNKIAKEAFAGGKSKPKT